MTRSTRISESNHGEAVVTDFAIVVDTREQLPYTFDGLHTDRSAPGGRRRIVVDRRIATLQQGDYSLVGHESRVAVERKSLADLFGTLGQGRERFQRELLRLAGLDRAAIVVESSLEGIFPTFCPDCVGTGLATDAGDWEQTRCRVCDGSGMRAAVPHSRLNPKTVFRSYLAWSLEYPTVSWHWADSRRLAEVLVFRWLARWHKTRAPLFAVAAETLETDNPAAA